MATVYTSMPLFTDPAYQYNLSLESQSRLVKFYWNERSMSWQFDIRNEDQTAILLGQKLVPQYPIAVDYPLEQYNISGYFLLLPKNLNLDTDISEIGDIPDKYAMYYVFEQED